MNIWNLFFLFLWLTSLIWLPIFLSLYFQHRAGGPLFICDLYASQKPEWKYQYNIEFLLTEKCEAKESDYWHLKQRPKHDKHQSCVAVSLADFNSILALRIALDITQKYKCSRVWCHEWNLRPVLVFGGIAFCNRAVRKKDFLPSE